MPMSRYVEDVFLDFYNLCIAQSIQLQTHDRSVCDSFVQNIGSKKNLTEKQANFLLRILKKYQQDCEKKNLLVSDVLENPQWRNPFRVLDQTKSISVEIDEKKTLWAILKIPFSLKEKLDELIDLKDYKHSIWDPDRQVRKIKFYNCNLIELNEFADSYSLVKNESFLAAISEVEEVWQNQESIRPSSIIVDGKISLINASEAALEYWTNNVTGSIDNDIFLAKNIGYPLSLDRKPQTIVEKISSSQHTEFWIKDTENILELFRAVKGKIAIIVNKDNLSVQWVKQFSTEIQNNIPEAKIKICFRYEKSEDPKMKFNDWIKDSGYGGNVEEGDIYFFQGKPAKWLFSKDHDVKIIVTNSLFPIPSSIAQDWMHSHPCVIYLGDQKASQMRDKNIVEL
jgi:hypothetical protein